MMGASIFFYSLLYLGVLVLLWRVVMAQKDNRPMLSICCIDFCIRI